MKTICPNCEQKTSVEKVKGKETIEIRGESFEVTVEYFICLECKEEFDDSTTHDSLEEAYTKYRNCQGLLQPEEIKSFRKNMGLTQVEMAKILGWGSVTLSRYENGALQDEAHEKSLRLAMESHNFILMIKRAPEALSEAKRIRLIKELEEIERESFSFRRYYEDKYGNYKESVFSGFKRLDIGKILNCILFFCKEGMGRTKLCKLLHYADFNYYKEYATSITGLRYVHYQYGPVPENFNLIYANLTDEEKALAIKEIIHSEDVVEYVYSSIIEPDLSLFNESELKVLATIKEKYSRFSAKKISQLSHKDKGYQETNPNDYISYGYADYLE